MRTDQQLGVVAFAQLSPDGPSELLGGERELRVDAGLIATRVLPVPTALQVDGDKSMHDEGRSIVGEPLVTQAGRDTLCAQQACEEVRFGEAETDALTKGLRGSQGDPGILGVPRVVNAVTHVLERG
jgi:hypothetical protein